MRFTITCTQADGTTFRKPILAIGMADARKEMREYRKVFTKCKNWLVIAE